MRNRIAIAPENDFNKNPDQQWKVSMATVVEGILRLISSNPKQDSNELLDPLPKKREALRQSERRDRSCLRDLYLAQNDKLIYTIVLNYLSACNSLFWTKASVGSFIIKTVGIQALFDVLREIASEVISSKDASVQFFTAKLQAAATIDFSSAEFRNASGSGRTQIKNAIKQRLT